MIRFAWGACLVLAIAACADAAIVRTISTMTNDLVYDPGTQRIYASVPSTAPGATGNSIKPIDPVAGTVGTGVWVGSEPTVMTRSTDGQYLYVALNGAAAVRRYDIATATAGPQFWLGTDPSYGPYFALDLAAVPGQPDSVAVVRHLPPSSNTYSVAIYDGGVARPDVVDAYSSSPRYIEFGDSASVLYGTDTSYGSGFLTMNVDASGVDLVSKVSYLVTGSGDFDYADGLVYSMSGRVVDPVQSLLLGTFAVSNVKTLLADPDARRVYFVTRDPSYGSNYNLQVFDMDLFVPLATIGLGSISGDPVMSSLIRWGNDGLAFRTPSQVFLVNDDTIGMVPEPATLALLVLGGCAAMRRRGRA